MIILVHDIMHPAIFRGYPLIRWLTNIPTYLLMRMQHGIRLSTLIRMEGR